MRPLGLGALLDGAVTFWRANWKELFKLVLGFQLVSFVLVAASQGITRKLFPLANDPTAISRTPDLALPHLLGAMALLIFASLIALYLSQLSGVATSWFAWSRLTAAGTPSAGDSFRHAAARLGPTTGAFVASIAWSVVVGILFLLPGFIFTAIATWAGIQDARAVAVLFAILGAVAIFLGMIVLMLWFVIRFILVSQVIAVETPTAIGAFRRSDALSSGRIGPGIIGLVKVRLTILVTVIGAILIVVTTVSSIPLLVAGGVFGANFNPGHTVNDVVPVFILVPAQLVQTFLAALVAPLFAVFQTWFYADMRARREGLDLELALEGRKA
ncbi:MAG: hypothetical protein QM817_16805 [Archangium sp.]